MSIDELLTTRDRLERALSVARVRADEIRLAWELAEVLGLLDLADAEQRRHPRVGTAEPAGRDRVYLDDRTPVSIAAMRARAMARASPAGSGVAPPSDFSLASRLAHPTAPVRR